MKKYTREDLENKSREELKELAEKIKKYALKVAFTIAAIGTGISATVSIAILPTLAPMIIPMGILTSSLAGSIYASKYVNMFVEARDKANSMLNEEICNYEDSKSYGNNDEQEEKYINNLIKLSVNNKSLAEEKYRRLCDAHEVKNKVKVKRYRIVGRKDD